MDSESDGSSNSKNNISKQKKNKTIPEPPVAKIIPHKIEFHGQTIIDEYFWIHDRNDPKVLKYLEKENAYADSMMKQTQELQEIIYNEFISRMSGDERSPMTQVDEYHYYTRIDAEDQYKKHCRRFESLDNEEQIILNENSEAEGEDYFHLGYFQVSYDHNLLLYGVDTEGNEYYSLRFKNLITSEYLDDEIYPVEGACWAADNRTILYTKVDEKGRANKLYRHILGENQPDGSDDIEIFDEPDEAFSINISTTNNRKFFLLHIDGIITNEVYFLSTNNPKGNFQCIAKRQHRIMYTVYSHGSYFFIHTNEGGAKNFKVVKVPVDNPSKEHWEEVLPHREGTLVSSINLFRHHFVAWEWENGIQKIRVQDLSDGESHYVQFGESLYSLCPGIDTTGGSFSNDYVQCFNSNLLRFCYTSLVQPPIVYDYDMDYCKKRKLKEILVTGYIKDQYHSKRIFAHSFDGASIPITLVYKISLKNTTGGNPLLLSGYGAYGALTQPVFSKEILSLLDRGFIYAIAHIRGEMTMGWDWYEQGKFLNKKNTFTDFITCAEHLISEEYTTSEKLAIYGKSAGGMMVMAVVNMRPDLFKAVIADVPFVDVFNSLIDPSNPFTQFEWDELGNPNEEEYCNYILSYSPYNNVERKQYPHILITAGLMDTRVSFAGPAKMTAKLRKMKLDNNMLLLKTYIAGHLGASGRFDAFEHLAFQYAFLIDTLGVTSAVSASKPLMQVISPVAITPPDLLSMFQGYQVTMILCTALDIGVFNELHKRPANVQTLAESLSVNSKGLARILDALVAVGILNKEENNYILTEISVSHLVKGMPGYIGDLRFHVSNKNHWNAMSNLSELLIEPQHSKDDEQNEENKKNIHLRSSSFTSISLSSLNSYNNNISFQTLDSSSEAKHAAVELLSVLSSWAARRKTLSILDLACGNGLLGFTTLILRNNVHVWSLDSASNIAIAKSMAQQMNITNRVHFIEVEDIFVEQQNFGGPYDLIIVGQNLFNIIGYHKGTTLLQRISDTLKSTGRLALYETIISNADNDPYPYFLSVLMFAEKKKGKIHTETWYRDLLTESGFISPIIVPLTPFPEKLLITYRNIVSHGSKAKKKN